METFIWSLRVRATGRGMATAYVRQHQVEIGVPIQFDEQYSRVTALEHLLAAVGADLVNGFQIAARRHRVSVDQIEALVSGQLDNALTYLGVVGEAGRPDLKRLSVRLYVGSDAETERVHEVWQETLARSPLVGPIARALNLELRLEVIV